MRANSSEKNGGRQQSQVSYFIPQNIVAMQIEHPRLAPLWIRSSGHFSRMSNHFIERTAAEVDFFTIIYCLDGQGWLHCDTRRWAVSPGDLVIAMSHEPHAYGALPANPWDILYVHFNGNEARELLQFTGISLSEERVIAIGHQPSLIALFNEMHVTLQTGYTLHHLVMAATCLHHILARLAMLLTFSGPKSSQELNIEKIINLMLARLTESCTLDELAAEAHMARTTFSRHFRDKTGYPPIDYYLRLKIQKACELLETTDMQVAEVSHHLGYADSHYFSRLFKKYMAVAPSHYRRRV